MNQIILFSGLYGLSGSILIVLFAILPHFKDFILRKKTLSLRLDRKSLLYEYNRHKLFTNDDINDRLKSNNAYNFYSTLWSFRLIAVGFLILILNEVFTFENQFYLENLFFVMADILLFSIVPLWTLDEIKGDHIRYNRAISFFIIIAVFPIAFYLIIFGLNIVTNSSGDYIFHFSDAILLSSIIVQSIFSILYWLRVYLIKMNEFLKIQ